MSVAIPAAVGVATVTLAGQYVNHTSDPAKPFTPGRVIFGAVAVGLFLSAIEVGAEDVAKGLATLIVTTAVLINGETLFTWLGTRVGSK